jgi:hypothetical protein
MKEKEYIDFLKTRNQSEKAMRSAIEDVGEFEKYLAGRSRDIESVDVDDVKRYMDTLIASKKNTMDRLVALARYVYMLGLNDVFIYFTSIIGGRDVLASISRRLESVAGAKVKEEVFEGIEAPPLGSPPEKLPPVTSLLVSRLTGLGTETCHKVLADNHHGVPVESFDKHKQWFKEAGSVDAFLERVHEEAVAELARYMNEGRVWYEQEITPAVVEFVRVNREVLSAVREGEYLYITKIPYQPKDWLAESDPVMRRYYACHCPLARAAIIMGGPDIPLDWCYCSGGFEKLMFDVVFEEPTQVEVLESVLAGSPRCRFRVKIPDGKL